MKNINVRLMLLIFVLTLTVLFCFSCSGYKASLPDRVYEGPVPEGKYTLIKYGANNYYDFATFALLIPEKGAHKVDIYKPEFEYKMVTGLSANEARQMGLQFVSGHPEFLRTVSRVILAPDGSAACYEIKILYRPALFGMEDLFDTQYLLREDNVIEVRVRLEEVVLRYVISGKD
jgi:hypothetical protein